MSTPRSLLPTRALAGRAAVAVGEQPALPAPQVLGCRGLPLGRPLCTLVRSKGHLFALTANGTVPCAPCFPRCSKSATSKMCKCIHTTGEIFCRFCNKTLQCNFGLLTPIPPLKTPLSFITRALRLARCVTFALPTQSFFHLHFHFYCPIRERSNPI